MAAYTAIDNPELYFQTELWTGDQSNNPRTLDGSEDMQPDFVWVKGRSFADTGGIFDSVRTATKLLIPSGTGAESTVAESLKSFDSDGFTMGTESALNKSSNTMVAWCWKAGGSASSQTDGTIDTSRSVSTTAGFSIATYTGNGTNGATRGHGLGVVPHFIIVKNRTDGVKWYVYHHKNTAAPETDYLELNANSATTDQGGWNDTAPTSTLVTTADGSEVNQSSKNYVMYSWAGIQGFSKFGSYTGNGNADGAFVYTGFKPAYVICKNISGTGNWGIKTAKSQVYNGADVTLFANSTGAESAFSDNKVDLLSNGFKILTASSDFNTSGSTYIYMAFAEAPLVNSEGVPCTAR
jgi:hypothetical protein